MKIPVSFFKHEILYRWCFLVFLFSFFSSYSQSKTYPSELGTPLIQNFGPKQYNNLNTQHWFGFQSKSGFLYFNNHGGGLLEYDGVSWTTLSFPIDQITSAAQNNENRIYVSNEEDFGYIDFENSLWPYYVSLKKKLLSKYNLSNIKILGCFNIKNKIFFVLENKILVWEGENILKVISSDSVFASVFSVDNKLYLKKQNGGIYVFNNNRLIPLANTDLISTKTISGFFSNEKKELLLITENGEFYKYNNQKVTLTGKIPKEFSLNMYSRNAVIKLPDGNFAFNTSMHGVLICNSKGNYIQHIDKEKGLIGNRVNNLFLDHQKGLWASTDFGLSRVEIVSPLTVFDDNLGIPGIILKTIRHQGSIYFGTSEGLYKLEKKNYKSKKRVTKISNYTFPIIDIYSDNELLLICTESGVYEVLGDHLYATTNNKYKSSVIIRSQINRNIFYAGTEEGFMILERIQKKNLEKGEWKKKQLINISNKPTTNLVELGDGSIWVDNIKGIFQVTPTINRNNIHIAPSNIKISYSKESKQHPDYIKITKFKDTLLILGNEEFEFYNSKTKNVEILKFEDTSHKPYPLFFTNGNKNFFYTTHTIPSYFVMGTFNGKNYKVKNNLLTRLKRRNGLLFSDGDSIIWLSNMKSYRFDISKVKDNDSSLNFKTLIRRIKINNDSVLYAGIGNNKKIELKHSLNTISFAFGAPTYDGVENTKFKFYLEGFDKEWPPYYDYPSSKEYANLDPGTYTLHAKGRNVHLTEGQEATFTFTILPPWHQTWWAYGCYTLLFIIFTWGVIKWRTQQIVKKNEQLEITIAERTKELASKNEKLKNLDETKSQFFTNVSHEFRTPLTLIRGLMEKLLKNDATNYDYKIVYRNTKRLHDLINQLLDIAKLESGEMRLTVAQGDISTFITILVSFFSSLATVKKIDYQFEISEITGPTWFDKDKLEKIIINLISNAFKFTPENESITIKAYPLDNKPGYLQMIVKDTGIGISEDKLPYLFERFYQVNSSKTREQESTGIGLSLVKELITIYNGEIEVKSTIRQGTTCVVTLPIDRSLFDLGDICDEPHTEGIRDPQIEYSVDVPLDPFDQDADANSDSKNTILLVEDNKDLRTYIKDSIPEEFNIIEAENGVIGLKVAVKHIPDIIITDIMMPKMDGEELCEKLKTNPKTNHIPVIMLTAKADQQSKIKGFNIGADAYMSKPFSTEELNARIHNLITIREKLKLQYQKNIVVNPSEIKAKSQDEKFIVKVSKYIEEHISEPDLNVESLMSTMNLSRTQLHRKLKALTGLSTTEFIRSIRLKRAAQLIQKKADSITQIGYMVGFSSHPYFSKCFKEQYGVSPLEYSKKIA